MGLKHLYLFINLFLLATRTDSTRGWALNKSDARCALQPGRTYWSLIPWPQVAEETISQADYVVFLV